LIVDGHIRVYRCEDGGSSDIEGIDEEEEDEMGQLEAHHKWLGVSCEDPYDSLK
jgi:hypothetical protein